jgi:hypothetical protein
MVVRQHKSKPAVAAEKDGMSVSPWKIAWRPQQGRWAGLIDGAGGAR